MLKRFRFRLQYRIDRMIVRWEWNRMSEARKAAIHAHVCRPIGDE